MLILFDIDGTLVRSEGAGMASIQHAGRQLFGPAFTTRGVDAGAKQEIYGLIRDLTEQGVAVVLISDELLELIGLSNRIAIMRQGRIVRILPAPVSAKPTEQDLVEAMLSAADDPRAAA